MILICHTYLCKILINSQIRLPNIKSYCQALVKNLNIFQSSPFIREINLQKFTAPSIDQGQFSCTDTMHAIRLQQIRFNLQTWCKPFNFIFQLMNSFCLIKWNIPCLFNVHVLTITSINDTTFLIRYHATI